MTKENVNAKTPYSVVPNVTDVSQPTSISQIVHVSHFLRKVRNLYFKFDNLACGCNKKGVENGDLSCDERGKCRCRCDIQGDKCSECEPGHQGFPECHGKSTLKIDIYNTVFENHRKSLTF